MDSCSARMGPLRLTTSMTMPPPAARTPSLSVAGDASAALASGRTITKSVSEDCAARCSRLRDSARTCCIQRITAPQLPVRKACSVDHSASALRVGRRSNSLSSGSPRYAKARPLGTSGGCTSAIGRVLTDFSAGRKSRSSPTPACCTSSSVNAPSGQPPPGNSADSAA